MYDDFLIQQRKRADTHLAKFLAENPEYLIADYQPQWLKGTHLVTFGTYCGKPAVFKYYDGDPRRKHEKTTLELLLPTGLVPKIYGETDVMLVLERLAGSTIHDMRESLNPEEWAQLNYQLGGAVAKVVKTAPGMKAAASSKRSFRASDHRDFYNTPYDALTELYREADTAAFFDTTIARSAKVLNDRNLPHKDILQRSLSALMENRDAILTFPSFVHMDDFHDNNIMTDGSNITGFIDLEMTRSGNEILLLGAALSSMYQDARRWPSFRRGYENARGETLDMNTISLIRIAAPFSTWIRFTWYCSTDDLPWWAKEIDHRLSTINALKDGIETAEAMEP